MIHYDEIYKGLSRHVLGQSEACKAVAMAAYRHQLRMKANYELLCNIEQTSNILLIGPTGSGKTMIVRELSQIMDIPVITINAKSIALEGGWVGETFVDQVEAKFLALKKPKTKSIIIFLDEFDKMVTPVASTKHSNHSEHVQHSILTYVEGAKAYTRTSDFEMKNALFIFAGAFVDLYKDHERASIGFNGLTDQINFEEALENFGMIPELIGRIRNFIELRPLEQQDFEQILDSPTFPLNQWLDFLDQMTANIDLKLDKQDLARQAVEKKLGVRGLMQVTEQFIDELVLKNQEYFKYRFQTDYKFKE